MLTERMGWMRRLLIMRMRCAVRRMQDWNVAYGFGLDVLYVYVYDYIHLRYKGRGHVLILRVRHLFM